MHFGSIFTSAISIWVSSLNNNKNHSLSDITDKAIIQYSSFWCFFDRQSHGETKEFIIWIWTIQCLLDTFSKTDGIFSSSLNFKFVKSMWLTLDYCLFTNYWNIFSSFKFNGYSVQQGHNMPLINTHFLIFWWESLFYRNLSFLLKFYLVFCSINMFNVQCCPLNQSRDIEELRSITKLFFTNQIYMNQILSIDFKKSIDWNDIRNDSFIIGLWDLYSLHFNSLTLQQHHSQQKRKHLEFWLIGSH